MQFFSTNIFDLWLVEFTEVEPVVMKDGLGVFPYAKVANGHSTNIHLSPNSCMHPTCAGTLHPALEIPVRDQAEPVALTSLVEATLLVRHMAPLVI